ncbi:uncharacterized protein [Rutidosis leptorrhynchoides]|uniref:uncharacterized protein n=1 Tax=Rutidosis leptorrhynchoides TaxID=125765 RepID=UPI003A9A5B1A
MTSKTTAAKEHVTEIRRTKFSIGGAPNPLTEDLHQAVKNLSAELYAKDIHFLMELIQNAEDNEYSEDVDPSLEFVITSKDITNTGAPATLLVFNNEKGFSRRNIESICSVGQSTKKGLRKRGYIGEKGIGFKSVFLITAQPCIFSNGYQIRFNEKPCQLCNVGYIVPEWVEEESILIAIRSIYGSTLTLPTTTLVLPLKPDKVKPVKDQLSSVHPEVLLFLSKIKRLSVKENNEDPRLNTVSAISIYSEKNFVTLKSMDAESYTLHLTADDTCIKDDTECDYLMWKQRFPVKDESRVDVRSDVEEWVITLAFPNGTRLKRGCSSMPGIYSFLPTETVTNFHFIIQADFLLASSRENILWDNKWNKGILDCVPVAFMNAFTSLIKSTNNAPISSLPNMFRFLPINSPSHPELNHVWHAIKAKILKEPIVPCESYTVQKLFRTPVEVFRLKPAFWSILNRARNEGVSFQNISSHGAYILTSSFDKPEYYSVLEFLEIKYIDNEWYARCISSSNLVMGVSEDVYLELLVFIAEDWGSSFRNTKINNIPLIKYVGLDGQVALFKINACTNKLLVANSDCIISWLINWNKEFQCPAERFFLPEDTHNAIKLCSKKHSLNKWLKEELNVKFVDVYKYAVDLLSSIGIDCKLVVMFAHFVYNSLQKKYLQKHQVEYHCDHIPIVDNHGRVNTSRTGVLVPASGSKWVKLIGTNPWRHHHYIELGEDYTRRANYFGTVTSGEELISFMKTYVGASDVPDISPPNSAVPTLSSPLTKKNTFLLLDWICNLRMKRDGLPKRFLSSIKNGSWLKISLSGSACYRPPNESFMLEASIGKLLQNASVLVDIPLIDVNFYGDEIKSYKEELQMFGVRFENKEACEFVGDHLMSIVASSKFTTDNVISILKFIQYLRGNYISSKVFIDSIKGGRWLRTSRGDVAPGNAVLYSCEWNAASQISDIPFIDQDYYGNELQFFKTELELLGVVVSFDHRCYQLVYNNLRSSSLLTYLSSEAVYMILECISQLPLSDNLVGAVKGTKCLNTNMGYRCPSESFLLNPESKWGGLLQVFRSFPILDESVYGQKIFSMSSELKKIGVIVDFKDASKEFIRIFEQHASSMRKENVFLLLDWYRKIKNKEMEVKLPSDLRSCLKKEKWLKTKLGDYRAPNECILFGTDWEPISLISLLPFIDDSDSFYGSRIHDYKEELKLLGVITDFKVGLGAELVAAGVILPQDCSSITSVSVFGLLDTVKQLEHVKLETLANFFEKLSQKKWIKTYLGYKRPGDCLLFDSDWYRVIKRSDGPFIDEEFYGPRIASYKDQLNLLNVVTDVNEGCQLLASYLDSHSSFESIKRIYSYLSEYNWKPEEEFNQRIWIPRGTENGEWVTPQKCVLHDIHNLFGDKLSVLEKCKYEKNILSFFSNVFNVKVHPSVDDYCDIWKKWESSGRQITHTECCAFWEFVANNWSSKTEDTFIGNISKLPVLDPTSDGIFLLLKSDVFIGNDLFLVDLFQKSSHRMFVWYPQPILKCLTRTKLMDIYGKLGVRMLSESVKKTISVVCHDKFEPVKSEKRIVKKGLFKLILGFLADPSLKVDVEKRHEAVSRLLAVEAFETMEPLTVGYSLSFSSGAVVSVEAKRMVRWDKQNSKFFMQKMDKYCGYKNAIVYASHYAQVIADGVLWENEEFVPKLSELIRLGFLLKFNEEVVDFLLKSKNLEISMEDQNYLSSTFSS